jgi:hypothetical protein
MALAVAELRRRKKASLVNLRSLPTEEPVTATGRVMWIWPEIQTALATGKTVGEIWKAAQRDGINIPYPHFRVYVSRLRRRERLHYQRSLPNADPRCNVIAAEESLVPNAHASDPFHNLRAQREKKQGTSFEYDPFSIRKDLIG